MGKKDKRKKGKGGARANTAASPPSQIATPTEVPLTIRTDYAAMMKIASTVTVHDYIHMEEEEDSEDPEGFQMSREKWPPGPLQAMFNTPGPPESAEHAVRLYEAGLASHPNHVQAHVWCAQAARLLANELDAALRFCVQSIRLRRSSDGYYVLAHILALQGHTQPAHLAAATAYDIDAWRPKVQHALQMALIALVDPTSIGHEPFVTPNHLTQQQQQQQWCAQCQPICPTSMTVPLKTLFRCSQCGNASYCSKACQTKAWKHHKIHCESPAKIQSILTGTTPAHLHVLDGWELPTLQEVAQVFGPSRDICSQWFHPPTGARVLNSKEYERRATIANASPEGYTQMQELQDDTHNRTITAFRDVKIRLNDTQEGDDLDAYRAARTAFRNVKHSAWDAYCHVLTSKQVYTFLTEEYVDALANYLKPRLAQYGGSIVEIGAGNGRLAFFLQQRGVPIVATDDCSWKLETHEKDRDVQIHDFPCDQALAIYSPSIVICAWMSMYKDFTASFCATPSVKEYILIGPAPLCGHAFDTWGFDGTTDPIYARSGFTRTAILELEKIQLCKMDKQTEMFASRTVSFQRIETC